MQVSPSLNQVYGVGKRVLQKGFAAGGSRLVSLRGFMAHWFVHFLRRSSLTRVPTQPTCNYHTFSTSQAPHFIKLSIFNLWGGSLFLSTDHWAPSGFRFYKFKEVFVRKVHNIRKSIPSGKSFSVLLQNKWKDRAAVGYLIQNCIKLV